MEKNSKQRTSAGSGRRRTHVASSPTADAPSHQWRSWPQILRPFGESARRCAAAESGPATVREAVRWSGANTTRPQDDRHIGPSGGCARGHDRTKKFGAIPAPSQLAQLEPAKVREHRERRRERRYDVACERERLSAPRVPRSCLGEPRLSGCATGTVRRALRRGLPNSERSEAPEATTACAASYPHKQFAKSAAPPRHADQGQICKLNAFE